MSARLYPAPAPAPSPPAAPGLHAAIIMDGNGRWAIARGRPRTAGHAAGADAVRRTVEGAPRLGIATLTLYAFSSDNWQRPPDEVGTLMRLMRRYLAAEADRCAENGVRVRVIGRRDRLPPGTVQAIEAAEAATAGGDKLHLRIAVDYSARDAIVRAARRAGGGAEVSREEFSHLLADSPGEGPVPDVDLLIRTGGEQRLSDFLLWECAYAELIFTDRMWPDFGAADLEAALREFHGRERRFGTVPAAPLSRDLLPPRQSALTLDSPRTAAGGE
ncbi:MAG TPA: di-trans,poly-cis-decaprenylcistransferase [Thermoanaerobaculia bacterium]|nr:di-trans,poly-cis-decaprenylcistransferase [Thermoanaerobaculia bacterium]